MKSPYVGGAAFAATLFAGYALFNAQPLVAETNSLPQEITQQGRRREAARQDKDAAAQLAKRPNRTSPAAPPVIIEVPVASVETYTATAYCFPGRTASGRLVSKGIIAADPRVLPLGSRVRLEAGNWSGDYTVADTGGAILGRKIDIWVPTSREAFRFGRRKVKLTVLAYGARRNRSRTKR